MPTKKKTSKIKRTPRYDDTFDGAPEPFVLPEQAKRRSVWPIVVVVLLVLAGVAYLKRGWFIAATVNGRPIWRMEFSRALETRFGKQTLEAMISESLIEDAASKANVTITKEELEKRQQDLLSSLGQGVSLDDLLKFQGMTREDFDKQLRLQLLVQKIVGKDIQITPDDVNQYIATSSAFLTATEPGALQEEARQAILDQKVSERVQLWFNELKEKATVMRFL